MGPPVASDGTTRGGVAVPVANHAAVVDWLKTDGLTMVKVHELLFRRGIVVPQRPSHRGTLEVCDVGRGRRGSTVRVDDGKPGDELQVDFGRLGLVFDAMTGRQRVCRTLIVTPVVSPRPHPLAAGQPRVERVVPFVRQSFFAGETFIDLRRRDVHRSHDAQRRAEDSCRERAGCAFTARSKPARRTCAASKSCRCCARGDRCQPDSGRVPRHPPSPRCRRD